FHRWMIFHLRDVEAVTGVEAFDPLPLQEIFAVPVLGVCLRTDEPWQLLQGGGFGDRDCSRSDGRQWVRSDSPVIHRRESRRKRNQNYHRSHQQGDRLQQPSEQHPSESHRWAYDTPPRSAHPRHRSVNEFCPGHCSFVAPDIVVPSGILIKNVVAFKTSVSRKKDPASR